MIKLCGVLNFSLTWPKNLGNQPSLHAFNIGFVTQPIWEFKLVTRAKQAPPTIKNIYKGPGKILEATKLSGWLATSLTGNTPDAIIAIIP